MMINLRIAIALTGAVTLLSTALFSDECSEIRKMRINELVPDSWIVYPAIEPAIPADFIMKELPDALGIVWGAKEDVEALDDLNNIKTKRGFFFLRHSMDILQEGPNQFSNDQQFTKGAIKRLRKNGVKSLDDSRLFWGDYPIHHMKVHHADGRVVRHGWLGLNNSDKWVIEFRYHPTGNYSYDEEMWKNFLKNTKKLVDEEFYIASGLDMRDGYTYVSKFGVQLKAIAEKRDRDGKQALLVTSMDGKSPFKLLMVEEGNIIGGKRNGHHIISFSGQTRQSSEGMTNIITLFASVFTKTIDEFSFDINPNSYDEKSSLFFK